MRFWKLPVCVVPKGFGRAAASAARANLSLVVETLVWVWAWAAVGFLGCAGRVGRIPVVVRVTWKRKRILFFENNRKKLNLLKK
jgi:hypothetical protein